MIVFKFAKCTPELQVHKSWCPEIGLLSFPVSLWLLLFLVALLTEVPVLHKTYWEANIPDICSDTSVVNLVDKMPSQLPCSCGWEW